MERHVSKAILLLHYLLHVPSLTCCSKPAYGAAATFALVEAGKRGVDLFKGARADPGFRAAPGAG